MKRANQELALQGLYPKCFKNIAHTIPKYCTYIQTSK